MDMEALLCPQISMDVDETPLELGVQVGNTEDSDSDGPDEMPQDIKIKILLETEQFDASQIPEPLNEEEEALKKTVFNLGPAVQYLKLHCTSCNQHLGSAPVNQFNRFIHPLLHVLLCKSCYDFYCSGEFEKDEDGSELYCRWCGQGGKVMCCSDCCFVFCQKCVRTNLGKKTLDSIKNTEEWKCFVCNPQQLINLKLICHSLYHYVMDQVRLARETKNESSLTQDQSMCCKPSQKTTTPRPRKRKRAGSTDDATYVPFSDEAPTKKTIPLKVPAASPSFLPTNGRPVINPMAIRTPTMVNNFIRINPMLQANQVGAPRFGPMMPRARPRMMGGLTRPAIAGSQNYISLPGTQPRMLRPPQRFKSVINSVPATVVPGMKHNWFDQASALTSNITNQLLRKLAIFNIEQRNASSIEKLAGIHNQLQELLSNSVNQLIHIRKNLRSEFLNDLNKLKMTQPNPPPLARLPPPTRPIAQVPKPSTVNDDDDVILISNDDVAQDPLSICETQFNEISKKITVDPTRPRPFLKLRPVSSLMASLAPETQTHTEHIDLCDDDEDSVKADDNSEKGNKEETADICGMDDEGKLEVFVEGDDASRQQILRALLENKYEAALVDNSKIKIAPDPRLTKAEIRKMLRARVIVDPKYIPKRMYAIADEEEVFLSEADKSTNSDEIIRISESEENKESDDENAESNRNTDSTNKNKNTNQITDSTNKKSIKEIKTNKDSDKNKNNVPLVETETIKRVSDKNDKNKSTDDEEEEAEKNKTESEMDKSRLSSAENNEESVKTNESTDADKKNEETTDKNIEHADENNETMDKDTADKDKNNEEAIDKNTADTDENNKEAIDEEIEDKDKNKKETADTNENKEATIDKESAGTDENNEETIDKETDENNKIIMNSDINNKKTTDAKDTVDAEENTIKAAEDDEKDCEEKHESDSENANSENANSDNYDRRKSATDLEVSADPVTTTDSGIEVDAK